jgi:hypothetical protein
MVSERLKIHREPQDEVSKDFFIIPASSSSSICIFTQTGKTSVKPIIQALVSFLTVTETI